MNFDMSVDAAKREQKATRMLPISECVDLVIDHRGKTPLKLGSDWATSGYRALSAKNIQDGRIKNVSSIRFVSRELYRKWMRNEIMRGDILLTSEAPLGQTLFWDSDEKIVLSQRVFALRANPTVVTPEYLYAYITSPAYQAALEARSTGSTVRGIRQSELLKTLVEVPDMPQQEFIGSTLRQIDEKIALNRQMNQTLEQMGQTLFRHYFKDDPESEKWLHGNLGDIIVNFDSKRIPLSSRERAKRTGEYRYFGATSVMDYVDDYLFDGKYLLLAEDGSVIHEDNTPFLQYVWGKFWVNNHAHVLQAKKPFTVEYLYLLLKDANVQSLVSGAVQLKINQGAMNGFPVLVPPKGVVEEFSATLDPLFAQIRNNDTETDSLASLRETLLPRLISGKLQFHPTEAVPL